MDIIKGYNVERSSALASKMEYILQDKSCSWNSALAFLAHKELHAGFYVEGYVILHDFGHIVTEHGWIELNGEVIDVSYARLKETSTSYVAAVRFTYIDALKLLGEKLPINEFHTSAAMREAYDRAQEERLKLSEDK